MRKEVLISGIQRKVKGKNFEDGSLSDMINVRVKDKNWVGVGDKVLFFDLKVTARTYHIHDLGLDGIGIVHVYEEDEALTIKVTFVKDGDEENAQTLKSDIPLGTKVHLSSLNNILIVNGLGSIGYYVYEESKDLYRFIPPMPEPLTIEPYYNDKQSGQYMDVDAILDAKPYANKKIYTYQTFEQNPIRDEYSQFRPINGWEKLGYEQVHDKFNKSIWGSYSDDDWNGTFGPQAKRDIIDLELLTEVSNLYRTLNDEDGVIVGEFFLVAAYELFDGTIIKPTAPIAMKYAYVDIYQEQWINIYGTGPNDPVDVDGYSIGAIALKRPFRFKLDIEQIQMVSDLYDGIITGVKLYVSQCSSFEVESKDASITSDLGYTNTYKYTAINWGELSLNDIDNFYFLKSYSINDLLSYQDFVEYSDKILSFDQISQSLPVMPIDNFTHHGIESTKKVFTYNSRLIMSNVRSKLFNGFDSSSAYNPLLPSAWQPDENKLSYSIAIITSISIDGEIREVFSGWNDFNDWYYKANYIDPFSGGAVSSGLFAVPFSFDPHFIYPDSRATKVKFLFRMNEGVLSGTIWSKKYNLKPHSFMNISYIEDRPTLSKSSLSEGRLIPSASYLSVKDTEPTDWQNEVMDRLQDLSKDIDTTPTSGVLKEGEPYFTFYQPSTLTYPSGKTELTDQPDMVREYNFVEPTNTQRTDQNRVQVSELNNPFIFPAKNSYRVGNGSIKALVNVTQEFGSGQFGDYPIVAFTDDGIWALAIGQGDLFISHVVPLAKDTTNNPDTISVVRDGIFFASDTGLKLLVGKESVHVSDIIEGSIRVQSGILRAILYELGKYAKENELSQVDFNKYIENCRIGYDRTNEEMIISNPECEYSYVYMFNSKLWTKRSEVFDSFLNSYPYTIGQRGTSLYNTSKEGGIDKRYMMLSNPIEFDEDSFTKLQSLVVRGFHGHTNLQVFGTTDNINYKLILSTQTTQDSQDLHLKRAFYSCKAYVVFISGEVKDSHYINRIEVMLSQKFNNKLR